MTRNLYSVLASVAVAGTIVSAQAPAPASQDPAVTVQVQQPSASSSDEKDATLIGCLVQGSAPNVFIIENAKTASSAAGDKGKSYVLSVAPGATAVDLRTQVNRQVRIVGITEDGAVTVTPSSDVARSSTTIETPAATVKIEEKDMPKFSVRTVARLGDTCVVAG
jgi:hypothetical protein